MAIQAQYLPQQAKAYDFPVTVPGQPMTEEQEEQLKLAQIAAILMATATGKKAIEAAVVNQLTTVLRATDLTSKRSVEAFAKTAARLVGSAITQVRQLTWRGVASRSRVVGVSFPTEMPPVSQIPSELRYSRGTSLERAYQRVADEYQHYVGRDRSDINIDRLAEEFEAQNLTPSPRPSNISSDAVESENEPEQEWERIFRESETEERKRAREENAEAASRRENQSAERRRAEERSTEEAWQEFVERAALNLQRAADRAERQAERERLSERDAEGDGEDPGAGEAEGITLTEDEVTEIARRFALQKAEERVERMVSQDIAGTARNTHQLAMRNIDDKKVTGFRRVVHPELSESGQSCGLCIVASTMRYTKRDLLPIHSGCNCETAEIYDINGEEFDPGHQINMDDLEVFYKQAGDTTSGFKLKRSKYRVVDHPEYGPTLEYVPESKKDKTALEAVPFEKRKNQGEEVNGN